MFKGDAWREIVVKALWPQEALEELRLGDFTAEITDHGAERSCKRRGVNIGVHAVSGLEEFWFAVSRIRRRKASEEEGLRTATVNIQSAGCGAGGLTVEEIVGWRAVARV